MSEGYYTASDIWVYGEDDPASPFSDLLNMHAQSVADYATRTNSRLFQLENESRSFSGRNVFTPSGSVTLTEATASVLPGVMASVQLRLGNVDTSSGTQIAEIGTLAGVVRPRMHFAPMAGWLGGGHHVSALAQSSSGEVSVRWTSTGNTGAVILSGTWPV